MPHMTTEAFQIPGYDVPDAFPVAETSDTAAQNAPYQIPPIAWIFILGFIGYFLVRAVVED